MKPSPSFQFYPDDFLGGTIAMTHEERGLYIQLLCLQWTQGGVTQDQITRLGKGIAQPSVSHVTAKFASCSDGMLRNEKMERVRRAQAEFRASRSESGKAGASKRWHSHGTAIAQPMANDSSYTPSPSPNLSLTTKGVKALDKAGWETAKRFESALKEQWINDAGKWVNRIKSKHGKAVRVIAEVESAIKEKRVKKSPAQYAEQIWKEFQ